MPGALIKAWKTQHLLPVLAVFASLAAAPALCEDWDRPLFSPSGNSKSAAERRSAMRLDYDRDFGSLVLGGSVSMEQDGLLARALNADETRQLRARAGYDFGPALGYVTLGRVQAEGTAGRSSGPVMGLGMRVSLNRALQLTGELLHHQAGGAGGGMAGQGETLSVGAAFRF